jgi:hypothetical protein
VIDRFTRLSGKVRDVAGSRIKKNTVIVSEASTDPECMMITILEHPMPL